jgi:hypothetical protein
MAKAKTPALGPGYRSSFMAGRSGDAAPATPATEALPGKKRYLPRNQVKASIWIDPELLDRARDAVDALSGPPLRLTFTALLHQALNTEVSRLAKKHHGGKPFPKRSGELRRGSRGSK